MSELMPKGYSVIELMRFSAELLQVRASLVGGELNAIEQIRASARGLELRAILGATLPEANVDPLIKERDDAKAELDKHERLINLGAISTAAYAAIDRYSAATKAINDRDAALEWEAGKNRVIATANNKPHTIKKADALTPAGMLKADAINSRADTSVWYYQGDIARLTFTATIKINGQADQGAEAARITLAGLKSAKERGYKLYNYRAGKLGTVWVLEGAKDVFLTRAGFDGGANPVFDRPDMPPSEPGYDSMLAQQLAMATKFISWLDTLPYDQRHNQGVVNRKIGSTPVGEWVRLSKEPLGMTLTYRHKGGGDGIRVFAADFDALITELRKIAVMPEIEPVEPETAPEQPETPAPTGPLEITKDTTDATIEGATDEQLTNKLLAVAKDFYRGLTPARKDVARRLEKGTYDRAEVIQALKQNRDYLIERAQASDAADAERNQSMGRLYGDKSLAELEAIYEAMGGQIRGMQSTREMDGNGGRRTAAAVANEGARDMGEHRLQLGIYIKDRRAAEPVTDADQYAAKAVGFPTFSDYAASRVDKLPLQAFQVARAKYVIVQYLEQHGRADRNTLGSLQTQGANAEGPSALAQLRQDGVILNNLRAQSKPFSLAAGVTLATFVSGQKASESEQGVEPAPELSTAPEPTTGADQQHDIIEYVTKGGKGKTLRGIIRTDLTKEEAQAIDPYTWRMNGGYFIREKHLGVETSHIQAAPAPVVLSPEQLAERQATAERDAAERAQKALATQVEKLRRAVLVLRSWFMPA